MEKGNNENKGSFNSNFGFLMASIGSAVGLGIIWGFPYKIGIGGGFAFLLIYLILVLVAGYPLMLAEIAVGRKSQKGAIEAYEKIDKRFKFNGIFASIAPVLLLFFYCALGGYVTKYLIGNLGELIGIGAGISQVPSDTYFNDFITSGFEPLILTWIFLGLTAFIVIKGVSGGIEKFSTICMPALFVMLGVIVIRSCTLEGAEKGLEFIFKPNFSVFEGTGWINVLGLAGSQMFFALSLGAGSMIAYGSYMNKNENIEKSSIIIPLADTAVAIMSAMAVMPAVFAYNLEPNEGPGLLFVTLHEVFNNMGSIGSVFGILFYLLVLFAAFTSSIAMMEGVISSMMDYRITKGKPGNRNLVTVIVTIITFLGSTLVSLDALGKSNLYRPFGRSSWLEVFDLFAEGILMPLGGFIMAILLGCIRRDYLDDEVKLGSEYKSKKFVDFCLRYIDPIFLGFIVVIQLNSFFGFLHF